MATVDLYSANDASAPIDASLHVSSSRCEPLARPYIPAGEESKEDIYSYITFLLHRPLILLCLQRPRQRKVRIGVVLLVLALGLLPETATRLLGNRDLD